MNNKQAKELEKKAKAMVLTLEVLNTIEFSDQESQEILEIAREIARDGLKFLLSTNFDKRIH